jgi:hypothetical protein
MHRRSLLGALVLAATVAFVLGTALERGSGESPASRRAERPASPRAESRGRIEGEAKTHAEGGEARTEGGHSRSELRALGVDFEAAPFVALAAAASIALALAAWRRPSAAVLLALAAAMLAFAALDVREVAHQLSENRTGLALLAGAVAVLHAAAAAVAGRLASALSATRGPRPT